MSNIKDREVLQSRPWSHRYEPTAGREVHPGHGVRNASQTLRVKGAHQGLDSRFERRGPLTRGPVPQLAQRPHDLVRGGRWRWDGV